MTKHAKKVRRERWKAEWMQSIRNTTRQRREVKSAIRNGGAALAAAAAIAAGTSAYAKPIRFDNPAGPGHFEWSAWAGHEYLDILSDAASQPGMAGEAGTFLRKSQPGYGEVVRADPGHALGEIQQYFNGDYRLLVGGDAGDLIPLAGYDFWLAGFTEVTYPGYEDTRLPEGTQTYLGVRFDPGDGWHYGWIGVVKTGLELDAFAWGYETEPGISISAGAAPEPGTLAMLALGAAAIVGRRRR